MLPYPHIDSVLFSLNKHLQIRWYGLLYLIGFALCWYTMRLHTQRVPGWEKSEKLSDLLFYGALGVVLGGRGGYMLFYAFPEWIRDPLQFFKIWQGGMSFHGGLVGVIVALLFFCYRYHEKFWVVSDIVAPSVPLALAAGRLGNFINGELWGKVTDVPWAMIFPHGGPFPRHPSPLYAMLLEGGVLFSLLWIFSRKPRPVGVVSGLFLLGYGMIRIIEECFREPDPQFGYLAFECVTMGQLLCLPMVVVGLFLIISGYQRHPCNNI